ncbi:MAG: DUF3303 family protein [Phycisphaeraceae bacterium]|nr:DUF3303 family protein [Phycisphaeraceae bacterium]
MLFMVIESFKPGKGDEVGLRFKSQGRMMPAEVRYHGSWLEPDSGRCFQVMEAPGRHLIDEWIGHWSDLVDFEVIPVVTSADYWKMKEAQAPRGVA